jgi:G3E family GTPase
MTDRLLDARYRLDEVITTVDAATGQATLDRQIESVKQAAVADRLLLTKTDLVGPQETAALMQRLRALNPAAPILQALNGAVDPARLFDAGLYDPKTKRLDVQRWLNAEAYTEPADDHHDHGEHGHDHQDEGHDHDHDHGAHAHDVNRHDEHISAFCMALDEPILAGAFDLWLDVLLAWRGEDMLRIKGILNVEGQPGPAVIDGVQHIFHPTAYLKEWPSADRRSRIVFIGRDLNEAALRDTLKLVTTQIIQEARQKSLAPRPDDTDVAVFEVRL